MNNVSCDVCLDLIAVVKDGAASDESVKLVQKHLETRPECRLIYETWTPERANETDDARTLQRLRSQMYMFGFVVLAIGSFVGITLTDSMTMFYNIMIMPAIGSIAYLTLKKRWWMVIPVLYGFMLI
ncbi:MAG: zf-HC2 domain-containing protein, partial [Bacilli bacterium]